MSMYISFSIFLLNWLIVCCVTASGHYFSHIHYKTINKYVCRKKHGIGQIFWFGRMVHVEQELPTLPEHLTSPPMFSGVCDTQSLVFCVMFCRLLFVLLPFFFWPLCCLCPSIYGFWLPLWYLTTFLCLEINQ